MENNFILRDVMSQDEIDQILQAINFGNTEPVNFKPAIESRKIYIYDFKRPNRFSKENIRNISFIHELLLQAWIGMFSANINSDIQMKVVSIDQLTLEEFVRSIPDSTTIIISKGKLDSIPLPYSFIIEIDPDIHKLFQPQSSLENISKLMINEYSQVLKNQYGLTTEFELKCLLEHPKNINIAPPTEMGLLITIEPEINDSKGLINVFFPFFFLKPLLPYMEEKIHKEIVFNKENDNMTDRIYSKPDLGLDNVKVQVAVELGRSIISMKEAKNIGEGSIIELDKLGGEPVEVFINNVLLGRGEVCVIDENFAVRVTELLDDNNMKNGESFSEPSP